MLTAFMAVRSRTVVDLFSGAGGLGLGFRSAGFRIVESIDSSLAAMATHERNLGVDARVESIALDTALPEADVIIGGPPCQGFSSAGMRRADDHRNSLVSVFAGLVVKHRPAAFVFENVEGFLTAAGGQRVRDLLAPLVAAGYRIHLRKINAANFGVPQLRKRVIAIGGLGWTPRFPDPTHLAFGAPGAGLVSGALPRCPTLREAIDDLPAPTEAQSSEAQPGLLADHDVRPLKGDVLTRARALQPGQTMRDLPEHLWHESYRRRANRRVRDGTPSARRGGAPAGLRRLVPDAPCKAITGGAPSEFLHFRDDRYLTLRECARIQTFPDDFVFAGTFSQRAVQIGNAVPPILGRVIAEALCDGFPSRAVRSAQGALESFVPTLSSGLSPALKHTAALVQAEFAPESSAPDQLSLCL